MAGWRLPPGLGVGMALTVGIALAPIPQVRAIALPGLAAGGLALLAARFRSAPTGLSGAAAVVLLGTTVGVLRGGGENPRPLPEATNAWVAGRVLTWEPLGTGVSVRIEVHRANGLAVIPPAVARGFLPATWGASPRSPWLALKGDLRPDRAPTNPGAWSDHRAAGRLVVRRDVAPRWGPGRTPRLFRWREVLQARIASTLPGFPGRLAQAVLLGRGSALTADERSVFRRTGTSHLTAVSGLHVGLVAALIGLCLGAAPRGVRVTGATAGAWIYAALAGWSPSAVRAATLVLLYGAGYLLRRPRPSAHWLSLAVPWLLWVEPALVHSVSFRLSVGAVAGILFFLGFARPPAGRGGAILGTVGASLGAQWGTLPTALATFGAVSPLALAPNLIVVPLAGLFLPAALLSAATVDWPVAGELARGAALLLGAGIGTALRAGAAVLPFAQGWCGPAPALFAAFAALPIGWFAAPPGLRQRVRFRLAAAGASLLAAALCFLPGSPAPGPWVAFLDVGQGDAAVLRLTDGSVWLVDVGDDRGPGDAARNAVLPFLRRSRIRRLDGLVISHRHRDHVGGLQSLLEGMSVTRVYDAGYGSSSGTPGKVDSLLTVHERWPCLVAAGDTLHDASGPLALVLHPPRGDPLAGSPWDGLNNASVVLRFDDGPLSVLFAGDAEREAEAVCVAGPGPLGARILKVGHHGSVTSTSPEFLRAVGPERAIVSCGTGNRFGHPAGSTLDRLCGAGAHVRRTDHDGAVIIRFGPAGEMIEELHPPFAPERGDSLSSEIRLW